MGEISSVQATTKGGWFIACWKVRDPQAAICRVDGHLAAGCRPRTRFQTLNLLNVLYYMALNTVLDIA